MFYFLNQGSAPQSAALHDVTELWAKEGGKKVITINLNPYATMIKSVQERREEMKRNGEEINTEKSKGEE